MFRIIPVLILFIISFVAAKAIHNATCDKEPKVIESVGGCDASGLCTTKFSDGSKSFTYYPIAGDTIYICK